MIPETKEEIKAGLGWVKIDHQFYHIAVCENCYTAVFLTEEQRSKEGFTLSGLDIQIKCCEHPRYYFHPIRTF